MKKSFVPQRRFGVNVLPDFRPSGLLELESNNKEGVLLKHVEPTDANTPNKYFAKIPIGQRPLYKLMIYKDDSLIRDYDMMNKSCHIVGRASGEIIIADVPIDEDICSKQHCAIQFREQEGQLKIYLIDLESSNGTTLNGDEIPTSRYVQLRPGDVISSLDSQYELIFVNS